MASGCVRGSDFGAGVVLLVVVALISVGGKGVWGQQTPSCAANLVPCATYLNGTSKPPDTCCSPLKEAITNQLECLCTLFNDPSISGSINVTQALDLPKRCGISSDLNACNKEAPSPTAGGPPGTGTAGGDSGAPKLAWIGLSGLAGLVLIWASILA